jgi:predicted NBD/HSP70 family sugar kinase
VRQAVNLGVGDEPLDVVGLLTAACSVRCCVDNDVNIAALGAFELLRHDRDIANLAYLSVGTGIAAGIILDGHLHRGRRGVAGEIGHLPVDRDGPECECGLRGCLEAVASGPAIARHWPATATTSAAEGLLAAALDGDRDARAAVELIADHLAHAVYVLAVTFDVDCIIVGGGVADAGEPLLDAIRSGVSRLEARSRFVASLELGQRIELKPAGAVGAVGAAALAMSDDGCSRP